MNLLQELHEGGSLPLDTDYAIARSGMRALNEPISIKGQFGVIMLDKGHVTGWRLDSDKLTVRIALPLTLHKVDVGIKKRFDLTFLLPQNTNSQKEFEGMVINVTEDKGEKRRFLELLLSCDDAVFFRELCDFLNKNSVSQETMHANFGTNLGLIKLFSMPMRGLVGMPILAFAVVMAVQNAMNPSDPEKRFCEEVATASPDNPKPITRPAADLTPETIVKECKKNFGIAVPIENARESVRKGKDKK